MCYTTGAVDCPDHIETATWGTRPLSEHITSIATESDWTTRLMSADDRDAPPELLRRLAEDPDPEIQGAVAANPNSPLIVVIGFAYSDSATLRGDAALNPHLPAEVLEELAEDEDDRVRRIVAAHQNSLAATLLLLSEDTVAEVREAVVRGLDKSDRAKVLEFLTLGIEDFDPVKVEGVPVSWLVDLAKSALLT